MANNVVFSTTVKPDPSRFSGWMHDDELARYHQEVIVWASYQSRFPPDDFRQSDIDC